MTQLGGERGFRAGGTDRPRASFSFLSHVWNWISLGFTLVLFPFQRRLTRLNHTSFVEWKPLCYHGGKLLFFTLFGASCATHSVLHSVTGSFHCGQSRWLVIVVTVLDAMWYQSLRSHQPRNSKNCFVRTSRHRGTYPRCFKLSLVSSDKTR